MNCIVIGGGAAGLQAAVTIRQRWPDKSVGLIDAENEIGYFRTLLPQFMVKTLAERKLFFWRPSDDPRLTVRCGDSAESIDRNNRRLHLSSGEILDYENLIIACGGKPILPPVCPLGDCSGIFPLRSLTIARAIRGWLPDHSPVAILGGGLVGVKTAVHLVHAGIPVCLIEKEDRLLPQALTGAAASVIARHVVRQKIELHLKSSVDNVRLTKGALSEIQVDGKWMPCRTLLIAAGSVPEVDFLESSGLLKDGRLSVSSALQTLDERIYAAGDAVTVDRGEASYTPWTWPQAITQGKLAGRNVFAADPLPLNCLTRVNSMNLHGLSLVILGAPVQGAEVAAYSRPGAGVYRELFIKNRRIVGGALIGDISGAGVLHVAMSAETEIDIRNEDLLKPGSRALRRISIRAVRPEKRALFV